MKKIIKPTIILFFGIVAFYYFDISSSLLWMLFTSFALYDWDNRIIGVMALISLVSCPFLTQFKQDALAEQMAVYAFFFLTMVVTLQLIEYKRHPELFSETENK